MALKKIAAKPARTTKKTPPKVAASPTTAAGKKIAAPPPPVKPAPVANVTRKHLAAEIAESQPMSKKQAETVVDDLFGRLISHLKAGDRLRLGGLGVLEVKNRPARPGRNPATGAVIQIAASRKIVFRAAKELKESI